MMKTFYRQLSIVTTIISMLVMVAGASVIPASAASAPNILTYQGRLLDANGAPVSTSTTSMKFFLYTAASGGTCVWSNSSSDCDSNTPASTTTRTVSLTSGLFTENLGDTSLASPYAAIADSTFADNGTIYLEVSVAGETLSPRRLLTAVPYALNADTLDGLDSTDFGGTFQTGTFGAYEDDAAAIVGADAAFSYGSGGVGDLRVTDEIEVMGDGYIDNDLVVGGSTSSTETISNVSFSLGGNDLFVAGELGVEGVIYNDGGINTAGTLDVTGTATVGDLSCTDCLDFAELSDSLTLDANLTVNLTGSDGITFESTSTGDIRYDMTSSGGFIIVNNLDNSVFSSDGSGNLAFRLWEDNNNTLTTTSSSGGNITYNLTGTGDIAFQDASSTFLTLSDTGAFSYTLDATDNPAFLVTNSGTSNVTINLASTGDFVVQDNGIAAFTVDDSGNASIGGTLDVTGISTLIANVNANGGLDIDDAFVVADGGVLTTSQTANFDGAVDFDSTWDFSGGVAQNASPLVFEGATPDEFETIFAITDPTISDRTQTFQNNSGIIPLSTAGNTLFFTTSAATAITLPTSGTLSTLAGSESLSGKTLVSPIITTSPTAAGSTWIDLGSVTTIDINGGSIDGATIGSASASSGAFTTLNASSTLNVDGATTLDQVTIDTADGNFAVSGANAITITSTLQDATAIVLTASTGAGGMQIALGTSGLDVDSGGVMSFDDGLVAIGSEGAVGNTAAGDNDLYVVGDLEVDGIVDFDGSFDFDGTTFDADGSGLISFTSTSNAAQAVLIEATLGGIDISATGSGATENIDITGTTAAINLTSTLQDATAIVLSASTGAGGIDINAGTSGFDLDSTGVMSLDGELVVIGGAADGTTATGDADLYVVGDLEVDGIVDFDGSFDFDGTTFAADGSGAITLTSTLADATAIVLTASTGAGGIDINAGTSGFDLDSTGVMSFDGELVGIGTAADGTLATGDGDLIVAGNFEVDTAARFDVLTFDVNGSGLTSIDTSSNTDNAITLTASAGGIDISATGSGATENIDITGTTAAINITSTLADATAIVLTALNGGIDIELGSSGLQIDGGLVAIGSEGVAGNTAAGDNDLYVIGDFEVDGIVDLDGSFDFDGTTFDADGSGLISFTSTSNAARAVLIEATLGGIDISATGSSATENIDITGTTAAINITSTLSDATAIVLTALNGGIDIELGSSGLQIDGGLTAIGSEGVAGNTAAGDNDLYVIGDFEVDGIVDFDGSFDFDGTTFDADGSGLISFTSTSNAAQAVLIEATLGGIDISATGSGATENIDITGTTAAINITSTLADATAIVLTATTGAGGIDINAGTSGFDLDSTGVMSLDGELVGIGTAADGTLATGDGDLIVAGNFEVDTAARFDVLTFDVNGSGLTSIDTSSNTDNAITLTASAGGIDISATGSGATENIDITGTTAAINITSTLADATAIVLTALNGGIDIELGSSGLQIDGGLTAIGSEGVAGGTAAGDNDLYVVGDLEVDTGIYADGTLNVDGVTTLDQVTIDTADGDFAVSGANAINLTSTLQDATAIVIAAPAGAGGMEVTLGTSGLNLDSGGIIFFNTSSNTADAINLTAAAGGIDISATGSTATENIDITGTTAAINLTSTLQDATAIVLTASTGAGGIDIELGSSGLQIDGGLVAIGSEGVAGGRADGDNDLYVLGDFEVDGTAYFNLGVNVEDDAGGVLFGTDQDFSMTYNTTTATLNTYTQAIAGADTDYALYTLAADSTAIGMTANAEVFEIGKSGGSAAVPGWVELFAVDEDGDVTAAGTVTLDLDTTASQEQAVCHPDGDTTDVVLGDCDGAPTADYAEQYPVAQGVSYGDIVVPGIKKVTTNDSQVITQLVKSSAVYQGPVAGVVSNNYGDFTSAGYNVPENENPMPVALVGRVPVNVTNENGAISVGDYLTTSSTPGYAMKATEVGRVIGMALNDFSDATGQVMVQVNNGWYMGDVIASDGSSTVLTDKVVMAPLGNASAATPAVDSYGFALRGSAWNGAQAQAVEMMVKASVTDQNNYRLSVRNTTDTEVAYITNTGTMQLAGDLVISGKIYPSDRGTPQTSKYIYYDGSEGAGGDFMRTNAKGWSTGSYDFAEMFPSEENLQSGEVVVFAGDGEKVMRSMEASSAKIAGIVSTRPGFLAGENASGAHPIALAGRVPTRVSAENGEVKVGDPLTTSSKPGYAMKATKSGMIVGYALESFVSGEKSILVYVNVGYWGGEATSAVPGTNNQASGFASSNNVNYTALNMSGNIYVSGHEIMSVGRIAGISDVWSIEQDGTIKTEATLKVVTRSYTDEKVETLAVTSPESVITLTGTAKLSGGQAEVRFEDFAPSFNDVTATDAPLRVIVSPTGPVSLYVSQKDNNHFVVKQFAGEQADWEFDWMVTAYRKGHEPKEEVEEVKEVEEAQNKLFPEPVEGIIDDAVSDEPAPPESPDSNLVDSPTDDEGGTQAEQPSESPIETVESVDEKTPETEPSSMQEAATE